MFKKSGIGVVLLGLVAGCGSKMPSAEEIKSYKLTEQDLRTFAKTYPDINPTFQNLIPVMDDLQENAFETMAKIKYPRQTADAVAKTDFQDLGHFVKVYTNVKLAVIRLLAEKNYKELEAQKKQSEEAAKKVDEALKKGEIKEDQAKALKDQYQAQQDQIKARMEAVKPYTQIEVSQANLDLVRKFFFDLSSVLIKANDYETFE